VLVADAVLTWCLGAARLLRVRHAFGRLRYGMLDLVSCILVWSPQAGICLALASVNTPVWKLEVERNDVGCAHVRAAGGLNVKLM
jgi:hypothetical protein